MTRFKWDVFVSYASRDAAICELLVGDLRAAGLRVWHDRSAMTGGDRIRERINEGIRNCACVVVLLSLHSLRSKWALNELDAAMLREIKECRPLVIPVLLGRIADNQIPADLSGKHYIDLRFGFFSRYATRRKVLLRSIQLITPQKGRSGGKRRILGPDFISFLFSRRYDGRPVSRMTEEWWEALADAFLLPSEWPVEFLSALNSFEKQCGLEGVKRLLMFVSDAKRINFALFTEEELADVLSEAQWFIMMMSVHEHARRKGDLGIEVRMTRSGNSLWRVIPGVSSRLKAKGRLPRKAAADRNKSG